MRIACLLLLATSACALPDAIPDWIDEIPIEGDAPPCAPPRDEQVACVVDGDTFDVGACGEEEGERVRMLGIDAPEVAHDEEPAECYAEIASAELARLIDGQQVTLTFDVECIGVYDRTLAYVWMPDEEAEDEEGILLNELLLLEGYVRLYEEDWVDDLRMQQRLEDAQAEAQSKGVGLWGACDGDSGA